MKSKIHIIRHGITEGNKNRWYYGRTDLPLLEEGKERLLELKSKGIYPEIDEDTRIVTSPLCRTHQTLETIYGKRNFEMIEDFREWDCGDFECKTYNELKEIPEYVKWLENETVDTRTPGGESRRDVYDRVNKGFDELIVQQELLMIKLRNRPKDAVTLAVIHGAVIASIMSRLFGEGIEDENFWSMIPEPGRGYTVLMEDGSITGYEKI